METLIKVGIIGATGYVGQQLLGLLNEHPKTEIVFLSSHSFEGMAYEEIYGHYLGRVHQRCISLETALDQVDGCDFVFIALPHGKSLSIMEALKNKDVKVIDFGGDFRMNDPAVISDWYGCHHEDVELLKSVVYGLPELNHDEIVKTKMIANPGCYPTASLLALLPLMDKSYIDKGAIVIDGKSGVTGAGRKSSLTFSFSEVNENFKAYGLSGHRHRPEIEEVLSSAYGQALKVIFTPHLVPMQRGLLITAYVPLKMGVSLETIEASYKAYYKDSPFVRLLKNMPETKHVSRTNYCDIALFLDTNTHRLVVVSAIDNLVKGSAGQAIQNMNLMMVYSQTLGLLGDQYYL